MGNIRMMKAAEKLGMLQEARIRKVRYYNDEYYDSVKYGILREEWSDDYELYNHGYFHCGWKFRNKYNKNKR